MSEFVIRSGGLRGTKALVDKEGCLRTVSNIESVFTKQSRKYASSYELHPPSFILTNASGYTPVVYMKNISTNKHFHIEHIRLDWNGGNTNFNRTMGFRTYVGMSEPTANAVVGKFGADVGPHNLNLASNINPEVDFRYWDGVGTTGMTVSSVGDQINCGISKQGQNFIRYSGALIIPPQVILGVSLKASDEDGKGVVVISGYFKIIGE